MKSEKDLFDELIKLNKKLESEIDNDATKFSEILDYFLYKTLKQVEEDNIEDGFIDRLEEFGNEAEKLEKESKYKGLYNLSDIFMVLMQLLVLKRDGELKEDWAIGFKGNINIGG